MTEKHEFQEMADFIAANYDVPPRYSQPINEYYASLAMNGVWEAFNYMATKGVKK